MSAEPWRLERHLFTRCDVVVLFLDMDPSLNEKDLALPSPHATSATSSNAPPLTRYEVIRAALRSFWMQKERSASNLHRLSLAIYGVWDDVVELMPVTSSSLGAQVINDALYQYLGENSPTYQGSSVPASSVASSPRPAASHTAVSFPFHAVGEVLKQIAHAEELKVQQSKSPDTYTVVQGLVLLSRPSAPPISAMPNTSATASSDAQAECLLDVVCLSPLSQPSSAYDVVVHQKGGRGGAAAAPPTTAAAADARAAPRNTSLPNADKDAQRTATDVPCTVIDPVAFTGISHKGLAVGPSLTKLLCLHQAHAKTFLETPLTLIDIPFQPPAAATADDTTAVTGRPTSATKPAAASPRKAAKRRSSTSLTEASDAPGFSRLRSVATNGSLTDGRTAANSPDQRSPAHSRVQSLVASPNRSHHMSPVAASPVTVGALAQGGTQPSAGGRPREKAATTPFAEAGRLRSAASVTFDTIRRDDAADSDFTQVTRAETSIVNTPNPSSIVNPAAPREPRPPPTGEGSTGPLRFSPHKSSVTPGGAATGLTDGARKPASSRVTPTTANTVKANAGANGTVSKPSTAAASAAANSSTVSLDATAGSSSSGPAPPSGPRLRPSVRVNSLTNDNAGTGEASTADTAQTPNHRLPPRPLAGSARITPTTTLTQRARKDNGV